MNNLVDQTFDPAVPIERLLPHPLNPREGRLQAIDESMIANGFYGAVVAQKSTRFILVGSHRFMVAKTRGAETLPVIWVDVDDRRARAILLVDNRTNDLAKYDNAGLAELLTDLQERDGSLRGTAYDSGAVDKLLAELGVLERSTSTPETSELVAPIEDADEVPPPAGEERVAFKLLVRCISEQTRKALLKRFDREDIRAKAVKGKP